MAEILIIFSRTHSAIQAELLLTAHMSVRVMSLPSFIREGCGICLRIDPALQEEAATLLETAGIPAQGFWLRDLSSGKPLYTPLDTP